MPRKRTSKRRSAASSRSASPPDEELVFFLDRDLGRYVVAESLRKFGLRVEVHADHFEPEAPDTEWLAEVGSRGWVVLTKNRRILTNPLEIVCLLKARVFAFVLKQSADGELTGEQIAAAYIAAMPERERFGNCGGSEGFKAAKPQAAGGRMSHCGGNAGNVQTLPSTRRIDGRCAG